MNGHGEKMSKREAAFMFALLSCGTLDEAAQAAGISSSTARRWHSRDDFQASFRKMQDEVLGHSLSLLKASMADAVATLRGIMCDGGNPPSARASAARTLLDNAFRAVDAADILKRIEALEGKR
jgi:hypothetical protein